MKATYTRAEADEILRRALTAEAEGDISHDELVAAAREVGIPEDAIAAAAGQLGEHAEVQRQIALIRRRKVRAFVRHLVVFVIVNAGVFAFDWLDGGPWFFQFPLVVWSVLLMLLGLVQLAPNAEALARRAEREIEKQRRREAARRRRLGQPPQRVATAAAAREFEAAVERGVSSLVAAATRAVQGLERRVRVESDDSGESSGGDESRRNRRASRP